MIGRRDGTSWVTRIAATEPAVPGELPAATPIAATGGVALAAAEFGEAEFVAAVRTAIDRIRRGAAHKVVIARPLRGVWPEGADERGLVSDLAGGYPDCWTFAVDGLIGSSPEMLVRVHAGRVSARVLAGSTARGSDPIADELAASRLASSSKDLDEHQFALTSLLRALAPHSPTAAASEQPFTLKLPNLWHLASDVAGSLSDGSSALDLVAALHPTAAVAGTPTATALELIAELEPFDRGRYAGPVGWIGADGAGEWAIALRCARIDAGSITAFAGAGIVADSVPEHELAETTLKFLPVVNALG